MDYLQTVLKSVPVEQLVGNLVSDIRFRTEFTEEKSVLDAKQIADLIQNKPIPPSKHSTTVSTLLKLAKPTVIIKSKVMGDRVYAPYGEAAPVSASIWKNRLGLVLTGIALVLVGTGFAVGRVTKK